MPDEQRKLDEGAWANMDEPLFASLYDELRRLAGRELRGARAASGMGATTLVHETFLNFSNRPGISFQNRAHFLAYAARAMRGLIVDRARRAMAEKRGGDVNVCRLDTGLMDQIAEPEEIVGIGALLDELGEKDPELAQVVDLKFFSGFNFAEIARMCECSERTVQRHWEQARLLLRHLAAQRRS